MSQTPDPANGAWHLDKRIPLAMIGAILLQTAAFGFWVGKISNRLDYALETNQKQDARIDAQENIVNTLAVNAATAAAQLGAVRESFAELKAAQAEILRLLREQPSGGN